jgi:malic enzyme
VITAGFINAVKLSGIPLAQHRIVFYGAGSAGKFSLLFHLMNDFVCSFICRLSKILKIHKKILLDCGLLMCL